MAYRSQQQRDTVITIVETLTELAAGLGTVFSEETMYHAYQAYLFLVKPPVSPVAEQESEDWEMEDTDGEVQSNSTFYSNSSLDDEEAE